MERTGPVGADGVGTEDARVNIPNELKEQLRGSRFNEVAEAMSSAASKMDAQTVEVAFGALSLACYAAREAGLPMLTFQKALTQIWGTLPEQNKVQ